MTNAALAARLHRDLGWLATEAEWSTTSDDEDQPQGHYTDPIEDALEAEGVESLADATAAERKAVRRVALLGCLDKLEIHFAALVDTTLGPRADRMSQISEAIGRIRGTQGGKVGKGVRVPRAYPDWTTQGDED